MTKESLVRAAFDDQHNWCEQMGSPFTARLLLGLSSALDKSTKTGKIILEWQGQPDAMGDSVALRLAGALHALVRRGQLPDLARFYPQTPCPIKQHLQKLPCKPLLKQTMKYVIG